MTVTTGASTSSETLVTFINQPAGGNYGTLKVCKLTETPAYLGKLFSFSVNGGPLVSTEANDAFDDPANWSCRILGSFQVGSNVNVHEQIPAGTEVQYIDSDPATALGDFNTSTGDALITVGAGVTVVLYDDEPLPPSGTGWLEICKDAAWLYPGYQDPDVYGSFHFDVTDAAGATYSADVLVGQCSEPFQVAAGISEVTEGPSPGYDLVDVATIPEDRLLTTNLINRTADVEVPASDSSNDETQLHFFNQTQRGQLKICKTLGPGSADLNGQVFTFDVLDLDGFQRDPLNPRIVASSSGTQCVIVGYFPIGHNVSVTEENPGDFIDSTGGGTITIAPGINTKTITNTAKGLLEVCKAKIKYVARDVSPLKQPMFTFRIDGAGMLKVRAGTCSLPQRVSVGTHTVSEVADPDYELDPGSLAQDLLGLGTNGGIVVSPADREVSRSLNTRTVTVTVPYGPNGETLVTFYNRVRLGQVKVCKLIPYTSTDSLGGKPFTYTVKIDGRTFHLGPIYPGECTSFTDAYPVLTAPSVPTQVTVTEDGATGNPGYTVTGITVTGGRDVGLPDLGNGIIGFDLGPGLDVVTYTNKARDP